jgi:beta-lactamase class A
MNSKRVGTLLIALLLSTPAARGATSFEKRLADLAAEGGGTAGLTAVHVESGRRVSINGEERFPMASVYKFPIAYRIMQLVDRGVLDLDAAITVTPRDYNAGHSPINEIAAGKPLTVTLERLVELALGASDNTASDILLRLAGGGAGVKSTLHALDVRGIDVTRPERQLIADWRGMPSVPDHDQYTLAEYNAIYEKVPLERQRDAASRYASDPRDTATPEAMAKLLVKFHRSELLSRDSRDRMWRIMLQKDLTPQRAGTLLPEDTVIAHKSGTMGGTTNDVALIRLPDGGHIAFAMFIKGSEKPVKARDLAIARVARAVYDEFSKRK